MQFATSKCFTGFALCMVAAEEQIGEQRQRQRGKGDCSLGSTVGYMGLLKNESISCCSPLFCGTVRNKR